MKIFISQKMASKTDEQIQQERERIKDFAQKKYGDDVVFAHTYHPEFVENTNTMNVPLAYLGRALIEMASCDLAVFAHDWNEARGCRLEHQAAEDYGIEIKEMKNAF